MNTLYVKENMADQKFNEIKDLIDAEEELQSIWKKCERKKPATKVSSPMKSYLDYSLKTEKHE